MICKPSIDGSGAKSCGSRGLPGRFPLASGTTTMLTPSIKKHGFARFAALILLAVVSLAVHTRAHAGMTCNGPSPASFTFTVPTGTYTIPRDAVVGTQLTPWTALQGNSTSVWTACQYNANSWYGPPLRATLASSGSVVVGGITYRAYQTNLAGVGLIMGAKGAVPTGWASLVAPVNVSWGAGIGWSSAGSGNTASFGFAMQFAFVKTGVITGGVVTVSGLAAQAGIDISPYTNPSHIADINLTGSATFVVLACTTPDVTVPMGPHPKSEFSGTGSTTTAVNFNIALNACPAGMNSIQYQIDPVTSVISNGQSVVALDNSSSAAGVGVQLLDGTGAAFPLSTQNTFSGYNAGTGGSYTIPMRARYYQTSATVSPGPANTSMTFTMTYQ